jgi:hypothetical protein
MEDDGENALQNEISQIWELAKTFSRQMSYSIWNLACTYAGAVRGLKGSEHTYTYTLSCGTRSLTAMESRAIAGGLSADHQLPGVPKAE